MNIITVKNLTKEFSLPVQQSLLKRLFSPKYTTFTAVDSISFSIKKGESVALLGPNGAGKTTTMKMLTGILYPTSGEITVLGDIPQKRNPDLLRKIGFVLGNKSTLSMDLTPMQNYELNKAIYRIPPTDFFNRIDELAALLEVAEHLNKRTRTLSLGQRMKAELINAILHKPEILYLDEPTIGLDITSQNNIRAFLRRVNKEFGTTILLTSHNMEDIENVSDRVIIVNKGRLVYDNALDTLRRDFSSKKYLRIICSVDISKEMLKAVSSLGSVLEAGKNYVRLEIEKSKQATALQHILEMPDVLDIDLEGIPLSRIIAAVFKQG